MELRRNIVNQKLHDAGLPGRFQCRKAIPCEYGLQGEIETNIIFDERAQPPAPVAVLGWGDEADRNTRKFISDYVKAHKAECRKEKAIREERKALHGRYVEQLHRWMSLPEPKKPFWDN